MTFASKMRSLEANTAGANEIHHVALFVLRVEPLARPECQVLDNFSHLRHKALGARPEDLIAT